MPQPSPTTPAAVPLPPVSDFAETQSLIQQITAEARTSGKSLVFDPDAPAEPEGEGEAAAPAAAAKPQKQKAKPEVEEGEGNSESETQTDEAQESTEADDEADDETDPEEPAAESGEVDVQAVKAALAAEGGVNLLALAKALGLGESVEKLGLTDGQAKFLRLRTKQSEATLKRAQDLAMQLQRDYGPQVAARKAVEAGELEPAIKYIEATFGREWNEINKMVGQLLKGQPVKDVAEKVRLRELEAEKAKREAADRQAAEEKQKTEKVAQAKTWIQTQIKGDPLASAEVQKQLEAAGFPSISDLVFQEMQAGYKSGLTDPKKALEVVRQKLTKQAKALSSVGLIKAKAAPSKPVSASKPRANAQTGAAGNGRPMTDAELRQAVLKEAGLWR